jgi:CRP-like cAMP-binding protein
MREALRRYISNYITLSDRDFDYLMAKVELRNFDKKQKLIIPGEIENYLNFVEKGLVRKYFIKGREEKVTEIVNENHLINSMVSFISGLPSLYFVEAIEPTTVLSITNESLENLYNSSFKFERLTRLIISAAYIQNEKQNYDQMRLSVRERFIQFMQNNPDLLQRVPQKHLASYLNIKPETFSRMKHLLRKRTLNGE